MMKSIRCACACAFVGLSLSVAGLGQEAADKQWPQFRGPAGSGVAPHADPPTEWSETKNIKWKVKTAGTGHGTPVIWNDRVYVVSAAKVASAAIDIEGGLPIAVEAAGSFASFAAQDASAPASRPRREGRPGGGGRERAPREPLTDQYRFIVSALDRATGKTIWEKTVKQAVPHERGHETSTYASATPVVDGKHVYAFFGSFGVFCLDMDGNVKWETDLGDMRSRNEFGEGSSPALHGDTLVIVWDHEGEDFIVALDKNTGKETWRKAREEPTSWATPLIVEAGGRSQVIVNGRNRIRGYDLKTGETIWECGGMTDNTIPTPVLYDGMAIIMSGFRGAACRAINLAEAKGDVTDGSAVVWSYNKDTPYVPSPLLYGDLLYFLDRNNGTLTCLNAKTGEKHFGPDKLDGMKMIYSSPLGAADRIYICDREGKTLVLKRGTKLEKLATNTLEDGASASPVAAGKDLFIRGYQHLYCISQ